MPDMVEETTDKAPLIAQYKTMLKQYVDRRPSGLRGRLAAALGKHRSFISQITNPSYRVPIPASDLQTVFDICHLSRDEREAFLSVYNSAHSMDIELGAVDQRILSEVRITVPAFHNPILTKEVERMIRDFSDRLISLGRKIDTP